MGMSPWGVHECPTLFISLKIEYPGKRSDPYQLTINYINITFPERVIVDNIIPRNVIINRGAAEVDNHVSRDDIFDYHPLRECYIYFIIPNTTLDPLFSTVCFLLRLDLPW